MQSGFGLTMQSAAIMEVSKRQKYDVFLFPARAAILQNTHETPLCDQVAYQGARETSSSTVVLYIAAGETSPGPRSCRAPKNLIPNSDIVNYLHPHLRLQFRSTPAAESRTPAQGEPQMPRCWDTLRAHSAPTVRTAGNS